MAHSRRIRHIVLSAALAAAAIGRPALAGAPVEWDGLTRVRADKLDYLYLRPGADFRQYNAIMLDPTEVSFRKGWQKETNRTRVGAGSRVTDAQIRRTIDSAQGKLRTILEKRLSEAGFPIVSAPAENVLRVFVGIADVEVTAPELRGPGLTVSEGAGRATVVIEVRDSLSGEILGRAVDHGNAAENLVSLRSSASNWADFERLFDEWARITAAGFRKLIASSPVSTQ